MKARGCGDIPETRIILDAILTQLCVSMMQGMKRGDIWDVVSSLAHALSEARDQLVNLMNHDDDA